MRPTLYEIAKLAGVSTSTVSRVLNHDTQKPASKATAERVFKIARELGYISDSIYPQGKAGSLICLLVSPTDNFNNYFFSQILIGIQEECERTGYELKQAISISLSNFYSILGNLEKQKFDGIILLGRITPDIMDRLKLITQNLVYAGLNSPNANIDEVLCDAYQAISKATQHLIHSGLANIGFLGTIPSEDFPLLNEHRYRGYRDTLASNSYPFNPQYCCNIPLTADQAYEAVTNIIKQNSLPDAFVCADDYLAIGAISALRDHNYKIPEDISIMGLADVDIAPFMLPRLSTVQVVKKELGTFAVKILIDRILGLHTIPVKIEFPSNLVIRESTR